MNEKKREFKNGNIVIKCDGTTAIVRINRTDKLNALSRETLLELLAAMELLDDDHNVRVVIITGSGDKAFSVGADIAQFSSATIEESMDYFSLAGEVYKRIEGMKKVVIAAVNGYALGGGLELLLACDIRIASEKAQFGLPEVKIGVMPCWGGTQRLPRLIGLSRTKNLALTGNFVNAEKALEWGIVTDIAPHEDLLLSTLKMAETLSLNSPFAMGKLKQTLNSTFDHTLDEGLQFELSQVKSCLASDDYHEGTRAFVEKRKPVFRGR